MILVAVMNIDQGRYVRSGGMVEQGGRCVCIPMMAVMNVNADGHCECRGNVVNAGNNRLLLTWCGDYDRRNWPLSSLAVMIQCCVRLSQLNDRFLQMVQMDIHVLPL